MENIIFQLFLIYLISTKNLQINMKLQMEQRTNYFRELQLILVSEFPEPTSPVREKIHKSTKTFQDKLHPINLLINFNYCIVFG